MTPENVHRLLGLCAICPNCREALGDLGPAQQSALLQVLYQYGQGAYLQSAARGKGPIASPEFAQLPDDILPAVESLWNLPVPVEEALVSLGPLKPLNGGGVAMRVMTALATPAVKEAVCGLYPEVTEEVEHFLGDPRCQCTSRVRRALAIRMPGLDVLMDSMVANGDDDPRSSEPFERNGRKRERKRDKSESSKLPGAGEIFECDANPDAFKSLMVEIEANYRYISAQMVVKESNPSRWQILLF